jgi:hypothetical protein
MRLVARVGREQTGRFGGCNGGKRTFVYRGAFLGRARIDTFVVNAKAATAGWFNDRESFRSFPDQPLRAARPMADIATLYQ